MKKILSMILIAALCLSVTACGGISLPDTTPETTEPPVTAAVVAIPSQTQVKTAFEKAVEVYGWFDLCALDCDSADYAKLDDTTYCRVLSDEVPTYDALRTMVYDLFDTKTADSLLQEDSKTPPYIDVGGVLYGQDFARGSDVTKGEYEVTVEQESKTCFLCKVRGETLECNDGYKEYRRVSGYEDFVYRYERVGNRWVFTDFSLFY
jgi:hypothetical protein